MKKILAISLAFVLLFALCSCHSSISPEEAERLQTGIVGSWKSEDGQKMLVFEDTNDGFGTCIGGKYNKMINSFDETTYEYCLNGNKLTLVDGDTVINYTLTNLTDDNTRLILQDEKGIYTVYQAYIA